MLAFFSPPVILSVVAAAFSFLAHKKRMVLFARLNDYSQRGHFCQGISLKKWVGADWEVLLGTFLAQVGGGMIVKGPLREGHVTTGRALAPTGT